MTDLAATLRLIAERAPALRKAGVRSLKIADIELQLDAPEPPPPRPPTKAEIAAAKRDQVPSDPLDDPMMYPGGRVPRLPDRSELKRPQADHDEHEDDDEDDEDDE